MEKYLSKKIMDIGIFGGKMGDFVITADSNCDLPESYIKENNVELFHIIMILTKFSMAMKLILIHTEFYELMRQGKTPTTVANNP